MSLWDALRMNMMISYQELVRTFLNGFAYLSDEVSECEAFRVVLDEFEDVWERGKHDGTAVAAKLLALTDDPVLSL